MNKIFIIGNCTRHVPQLKVLPKGASTVEFCIATNRTFKDSQDQRKEESEYHWCQAWGGKAEALSRLVSKGDLILVEGRNKYEEWDDKNTGEKRNRTIVVVEEFKILNRKEYENDERENED